MSTLGNILGQQGRPHTFEHGGKVFRCSLLTQAIKEAFEKELFDRAVKLLLSWKPHLEREDFVAKLDRLNGEYLAGDYDFVGGKVVEAALQTPRGVLMLARLLLGASEDEIFSIALERIDELQALVRLVLAQSSPAFARQMEQEDAEGADPNA